MSSAAEALLAPPEAHRRGIGLSALYLLLGFCAGLPFYMFNAVLLLRLARHHVDIVTIGYFAWVALLPTFKFAWAPLLDAFDAPGFHRFWGKRRGWIMLSQLGIFSSMAAMGLTSSDASLPLTALFATLLAFWATTLEVAADAWRIELAPTREQQGPIVAANLWGYRSAMVAAGSGAIYIAAKADWAWAYLIIAVAAFIPFPILALTRPDPDGAGDRGNALATGLIGGTIILAVSTATTAVIGWALLWLAAAAGISSKTNVTPAVLVICLLPFIALALWLPRIKAMPPDAPGRRSAAIGPYVDVFWRYGFIVLPMLAFVAIYRMGDVMALTLSHPLFNALGYGLVQISMADGAVALLSSMAGVALGAWMAARWPLGWSLAIGAAMSAVSNWVFAWLAHQQPGGPLLFTVGYGEWSLPVTAGDLDLYIAMAVDQFGHGFAGAIFVVYLSMLVNPKYPGPQYAFLSGFAFLLPRLLAGASGAIQQQIGYAGFFWMSGAMSLASVVLLPIVVRAKARPDDASVGPS